MEKRHPSDPTSIQSADIFKSKLDEFVAEERRKLTHEAAANIKFEIESRTNYWRYLLDYAFADEFKGNIDAFTKTVLGMDSNDFAAYIWKRLVVYWRKRNIDRWLKTDCGPTYAQIMLKDFQRNVATKTEKGEPIDNIVHYFNKMKRLVAINLVEKKKKELDRIVSAADPDEDRDPEEIFPGVEWRLPAELESREVARVRRECLRECMRMQLPEKKRNIFRRYYPDEFLTPEEEAKRRQNLADELSKTRNALSKNVYDWTDKLTDCMLECARKKGI
jgi:hypothetical protein